MVVGFSTFNLVFFGENLENLIKSNKEIHVQLVNDILGGLLNLFLPRCGGRMISPHPIDDDSRG